MAFSSLKEQYDEVFKRCNELTIKAAGVDAQLSTVNGINAKYKREIANLTAENTTANQSIKAIEDEKDDIYVKFKGAEADAQFLRGQCNSKSTRVTQLEEQNRMMRSEHQQFRETICTPGFDHLRGC
jgi:chromosome segregation ATPase